MFEEFSNTEGSITKIKENKTFNQIMIFVFFLIILILITRIAVFLTNINENEIIINFIFLSIFEFLVLFSLLFFFYVISNLTDYSIFVHHLLVILFLLINWIYIPLYHESSENYLLDITPTIFILIAIIISSLLFSTKITIFYFFIGIIDHTIYYNVIISIPIYSLLEKSFDIILISIILIIGTNKNNIRFKNELISYNNFVLEKKQRDYKNSDLNNFYSTASNNFAIPLNILSNNIKKLSQNIDSNSTKYAGLNVNNSMRVIELSTNLLHSLLRDILDLSQSLSTETKLNNSLINVSEVISKYVSEIDKILLRNKNKIIINVNNNIDKLILFDKIKLIKLLVNISKSRLNKETSELNLDLTIEKEKSIEFLIIKFKIFAKKNLINQTNFDDVLLEDLHQEYLQNQLTEFNLLLTKHLISNLKGRIWFSIEDSDYSVFNLKIPIN